eukprot:scaffold245477_cov32-Prasinocladus_malaysianus.AAC.2
MGAGKSGWPPRCVTGSWLGSSLTQMSYACEAPPYSLHEAQIRSITLLVVLTAGPRTTMAVHVDTTGCG